MAKTGVAQKPSDTALFTALRRTISNRAHPGSRFGPDDLAVHFLPPSFRFFLKFPRVRANTLEKLEAAFPGMQAYLVARTAYFDGLFEDALSERTPQVVLMGAGYDSRAYRFARLNQGTRIFELDAAPTQARKQQCLKAARIAIPKQVTFVPVDFNRESLEAVLNRAGWQSGLKSLFIWEGVSYYLEPAAVEATLEFFSRTAQPDSRLAFDYAVTMTEENLPAIYGGREFVQAMRQAHPQESILFTIEEVKLETTLERWKLRLVEHLDSLEIERRFLIDDQGCSLGKVSGMFRLASVSRKD